MSRAEELVFLNDEGLGDESLRPIRFGKYKGKTIAHILLVNPQYLLWADKHVPFFELLKAERALVEELLDQQRWDEEELSGCGGFADFWKD